LQGNENKSESYHAIRSMLLLMVIIDFINNPTPNTHFVHRSLGEGGTPKL